MLRVAEVVVLFQDSWLFGRGRDCCGVLLWLPRPHRVITLSQSFCHIQQLADASHLLLPVVVVRRAARLVPIIRTCGSNATPVTVTTTIRRKALVHDRLFELLCQNACISSTLVRDGLELTVIGDLLKGLIQADGFTS